MQYLSLILIILGLALISVGAFLIHLILGFFVTGIILIILGYLYSDTVGG